MVNFIHISDTHISSNPDYHPHWVHESVVHPNTGVDALVAAISRLSFVIDFILHTGDICADPHVVDYQTARDILSPMGIPIYMMPGNHDSLDLMCDFLHDNLNLHALGDAHIQIKDYHLITLNTNGAGDTHAPMLYDHQLAWLESELLKTEQGRIIIATHHPIIGTGVDWIDNRMRVQNGQHIHKILIPYANQLCGVFHGHIHQSVNSYCDGVLYASAPSTWYNLQAYPDLQHDEDDLAMSGGFNLVMLRDNRTFIRRYSL